MKRKYHQYVGPKANIKRRCERCGLLLGFEKRTGKDGVLKWFPVNPDGTDHWELCKRTEREGIGLEALMAKHPPARSRSKVTHVWCGDVPPWDESLGEYRDFTEAEKAAGIICQSHVTTCNKGVTSLVGRRGSGEAR